LAFLQGDRFNLFARGMFGNPESFRYRLSVKLTGSLRHDAMNSASCSFVRNERGADPLIYNFCSTGSSIATPVVKTIASGSLGAPRLNRQALAFAHKAPAGFEKNWIPTAPGKGWFAYFRLYGPTEGYFNQSWLLPDIELVQ
jgi:hypothetical protein